MTPKTWRRFTCNTAMTKAFRIAHAPPSLDKVTSSLHARRERTFWFACLLGFCNFEYSGISRICGLSNISEEKQEKTSNNNKRVSRALLCLFFWWVFCFCLLVCCLFVLFILGCFAFRCLCFLRWFILFCCFCFCVLCLFVVLFPFFVLSELLSVCFCVFLCYVSVFLCVCFWQCCAFL